MKIYKQLNNGLQFRYFVVQKQNQFFQMPPSKILLPIVIFFFLIACNSQSSPPMSIQDKVAALRTPEQQTEFLEGIYDEDQGVRKRETEILQKVGHESNQYRQNEEEAMQFQAMHLEQIEHYLSIHGYPSLQIHGEKAAMTPWLVVHHSIDSSSARQKYFPFLYTAWRNGNIDGGQFTLYLNRFYRIVHDSRLDLENPYTEEFEVDTLMKALGLQVPE